MRERVGGGRDYRATRLAMAGGLLQSVRCVLWMVQQMDGAGLGVVCDGGPKVAV